jgi:hypothetical protein
MKTWSTMVAAGFLCAATVRLGTAAAGDHVWTTAGNVLIGINTGGAAIGAPCAPARPACPAPIARVFHPAASLAFGRAACVAPSMVVVSAPPACVDPRPMVVHGPWPAVCEPRAVCGPTVHGRRPHHGSVVYTGPGYRVHRPAAPCRTTYVTAWSSRSGWILVPVYGH